MTDLPKEALAHYIFHPVSFIEQQVLRLTPEEIKANKINRRLEPQTKLMLNAVAAYDYVSIHSGRGVTKTTTLAMLAIWWVYTRCDARVMATGPKFDQLKATLWAEIRKWLSQSNLTDEIEVTSEKIYHKDPDMLSFGQVMTSKDKENISGVHATHVLWLIDEASNVEREIIDAIIGGMNDPESKIVMAGNPTLASGPFYDTHNKDRSQWYKIRLSAEDSARKNKVWFKRMQRYPKNSDMYRVNVDGLPPLGNPQAIIPLSDCHAAKDRTVDIGDFLEMGVDPAREGNDEAAIAIRRGKKLLEVRTYPKCKGHILRSHVIKMLREYRVKTGINSKCRIKIDDHGLGGPIGDEMTLNETDNIEVVPCLFGGKGDARYQDPASIMWFHMAEIIDEVEICNDEDLIEQLSTREWRPAQNQKFKVEGKDEYKKRVGLSPDKADACILCFFPGPKKIFEKPDTLENTSVFEVDWYYEHLTDPAFDGIFPIDILHYAALVLNEDLSIDGLAGIYQHFVDKLWIYEQFHQEHPDPDLISNIVRVKTRFGIYGDDRNVRILGNDRMFNKKDDSQPFRDVLVRSNLFISEPVKYDEYGAISLGIRMYGEGRIVLHKRLEMARKAITLWSVQSGKPDADKNGFAKALLLILSEVRRLKKEPLKMNKPRDYRPVGRVTERTKTPNAWCTR